MYERAKCYPYAVFFFLFVDLVGGGSVIDGAYPEMINES